MMIINLAFKNYPSNLNYTVATSKGLLATYIPVHQLIATAAEIGIGLIFAEGTEGLTLALLLYLKYVKGMVGVYSWPQKLWGT